ncbi:MAG: ComEC/Rec2 family competence protein [Dehalococcoidia bacterium]|nr:ComEC/Rec2 family competence protein [Dehalococcoidia bacterium]
MTLAYLGGALAVGVLVASWLPGTPSLLLLAPLPMLVLVGVLLRRRPAALLAPAMVAAALLGAARLQAVPDLTGPTSLAALSGQTVSLRGVVAADPEARDRDVRLRLTSVEVREGGRWRPVDGDLLAYVQPTARLVSEREEPYLRYGDALGLRGEVQPPPRFDEFDYREFLARRGIVAVAYRPQTELLAEGRGFPPLAWLSAVRWRMARSLAQSLPEPQAALAQGMVLGLRAAIPQDLLTDFARTGTTHILAVSGLNIGIVLGLVLPLSIWALGRRRGLYLLSPLGAIWIYALLTGMQPPVARSVVMGSLYLAALALGRPGASAAALGLAVALLLLIDPRGLWDTSFQLSFLAMAGLVFISPWFSSLGHRLLGKGDGSSAEGGAARFLVEGVAAGLGAILATAPLIALTFHLFSPAGLPATILTAPALPPLLASSILAALAGLVSPDAGAVAGWLAWPWLTYLALVVRGFAALPFAAVDVGRLSVELVWLAYGALALAVVLVGLGREASSLGGLRRAWPAFQRLALSPVGLLLMAGLCATVWTAAVSTTEGRVRIRIADVGGAPTIVVRSPQGYVVLLEAGASPSRLTQEMGAAMSFWERDVHLAVFTSGRADALRGLTEAGTRYRLQAALGPFAEGRTAVYVEWRRLLDERGVRRLDARAGQTLPLGPDMALDVVGPSAEGDSLAVRLRTPRAELLTVGDGPPGAIAVLTHKAGALAPDPATLAPGVRLVIVLGQSEAGPVEALKARLPDARIVETGGAGAVDILVDGLMLSVNVQRGT